MLVLEIEYVAGISFAATGPDRPVPDWPPQPDRVFSALVATWGARGQDDEEAEALEWLERQSPPLILERGGVARLGMRVFVPPNDARSDKKKHARDVLPSLRRRQERAAGFPATLPVDPVIRFLWSDAQPGDGVLNALNRLARDTSYVGHSTSLTRCHFRRDPDPGGLPEPTPPTRRVYAGRLRELRDAYARFEQSQASKDRPRAGAPVRVRLGTDGPRGGHFDTRWLLLEHVDGRMPDLRGCAQVARTIRDAMISGYRRVGLGDRVPEVICGHTASGAPSHSPHAAIIPLPFVGFSHADGSVLGFALVPPRGDGILSDGDFRNVLRALAPVDEQYGRRILTITARAGTSAEQAFSITLSPTFEAGRHSLDPRLYVGPSRAFATVTPIVLDRHLKERGVARQQEVVAQIVAACRNSGLPEPEAIVPDKHSAVEGSPSAYPSGTSPHWTRWRVPQPLASRQLTHAVVRFADPIEGPVILGAGRYVGLGLCRPVVAQG